MMIAQTKESQIAKLITYTLGVECKLLVVLAAIIVIMLPKVPKIVTKPNNVCSIICITSGTLSIVVASDGTFFVNNLPSGSYVVEVIHPDYAFEPVRVDINAKGKHRARRLNNVKLNDISTIKYPLKLKAKGKAPYFQQREKWSVSDLLFNPMVLMMVLPLLMVMVLPKLMNAQDPETQKEMQSQMNMLTAPKSNFDLSETLTGFFGGNAKPQQKQKKR
ncbi:DgyrCDS10424 [Dimorphilus gyrociliatus]|uniref:DgyrCDS10424 n=1 Tax=Dimorphilus gyrociliatus TaxID=2664684 RepID=A0A7I8W1B2_9ANNE|nr:DgyrCDS10424 [Dimorphilus gyrociliatus]